MFWLSTCFVFFIIHFGQASYDEDQKKPTFLTASIGESVAFNCPLDFPQDIVIPYELHWRKKGQSVFSYREGVFDTLNDYTGRISLLPPPYGGGSINLTNIRESDGGWYECRVYFPSRNPISRPNGTWFHLTVDSDNLILTPPINQTALEGERIHFPCVIRNRSSIVLWYKDGLLLTDTPEILLRSVISPEGSLTLSPTRMGDRGVYTCQITGSNGDVQNYTAFLNVQYKAKVLYAPKEVFMPIGQTALLDCHFQANPPLTKLRWDKDGLLFDPYNVKGVEIRRNGSLYFEKVVNDHGGNYTCTPFNELGTEGPSPVMTVIVQYPPVFSIRPHNLYLRRRGDSVEMPCDAWNGNSHYKPSIVWIKKDGSPLPLGRSTLSEGNLTIDAIEEEDRGVYQCVASNKADTNVAESELMVENVAPRVPFNLVATSTVDSITVSWNVGLTAPKTAESVWYKAADLPFWRALSANPSDRQMTIPKLLQGTEYEIMVLSQDDHGDGMFSKAVRIRTKGTADVPVQQSQLGFNDSTLETDIGPPLNIHVAKQSEGYVVTWQPPEDSANVSHYTVRWMSGRKHGGNVDTTDTAFLVDSLEEDYTYIFQVLAVSINGRWSESNKFLVHVPSYKSVRALSLTLGLALLLLVFLVAGWFLRKRFV